MKRFLLSIGLSIVFLGASFGQTTTSYDFSSSGAVSGLNEGSPGISLDANIGFGSFKNDGTSNPGIFSDQLRLYQNATKGGSIIIYANNGVTITDIVVNASDRTGPAGYTVDGGAQVNLSGGSTYTISGISATSQVEFFQRDANSSNRIYIDTFDVTYTSSSGASPTKLVVTEVNGGTSPSVGTDFDVTVELQDADDNATAATADTTVTISLGSGTGSLSGTLSATIDSASTSVTLSGITYDTAESITITATNTGGSLSSGTSSSVSVLSAADQLVLVSVPTEGNTGASLDSFTVEARRSGDSSVDLNYSKSITVSIASGSGTIGGTTSKSASSGVATFDDITIDSGGDFTIEATDGSLTSSASDTITITEITLVINEIMADPTGIDSNGDGTVSTSEDEFVELVNNGDSDLDISSWTIEDGAGLRHTFAASTVLKPYQAVVVFGGGTPTGEFGDALVFTASEGFTGFNNGGDDVIVKDDGGTTIVSYTYGSEGGDDQSITRSPDLTGSFAKHETADSDDASSLSPGTKIDGSTFQPSVNITGAEGWRILSTPTSDNSYDDLLGDLWTQGIGTGADVTNGTANVQLYNTSTDNFAAVTDLTATMTAGTGFITYVYSDDDYDGSAEGFPKLISAFGSENTGTVTPTLNDGADAWTLIGNPYASTIDWDLVGKTEVTGTVYVYDHSYGTPSGSDVAASGSAGSYRVWNGTAGSLTDGLITPFQGFWVQNASSVTSPALSIEEADKSSGGTFYKEVVPTTITLHAELGSLFNDTHFSFTQEAKLDKDNYDGYELLPLDFKNYLTLSTAVNGESFDINNLPINLEEVVVIPLQVAAFEANVEDKSWLPMEGSVTLSWPALTAIPEGWMIELKDYETGVSIDLMSEQSYFFDLKAAGVKSKAGVGHSVLTPIAVTKEQSANNDRFAIVITPTTSVSNETEESPALFALEQNYPNPFNPSTTISYSVQEAGAVNISVYNLMGQKVATLVDETKAAGQYNVRWNAAGAASGMYYYRLEAGGQSITRKMTLIK